VSRGQRQQASTQLGVGDSTHPSGVRGRGKGDFPCSGGGAQAASSSGPSRPTWWALLLGGLRNVIEHGASASAHVMRQITHLPRALLSILRTALTLLALCSGCLRPA
jgi:hypothetical protein